MEAVLSVRALRRRVIAVSLAWFPPPLRATPAGREGVETSPFGLHWLALDEDISVEGLLAGRDRGGVGGEAAWKLGQ